MEDRVEGVLLEEESIQQNLEELRSQISSIHLNLPCLRQCSHLSVLLQKLNAIKQGIDRLEQGLLQAHLKCCISPRLKIPSQVAVAVAKLSAKRHGAIIVIEQETEVEGHVRGGVRIDAVVNAPVLESIFFPGSPLHDGAVIIRRGKILMANCYLPLAPHSAELDVLSLGTRHRAAVGLSMASDALVIVVSEEKGWISLTLKGRIYPNIGTSALMESSEENSPD